MKTVYIPVKDASLFVCGVVQGECSHVTDVEKIQAYVFTPEELKILLEEYTNRIIENATTKDVGGWNTDGTMYLSNKIVNKKSITPTKLRSRNRPSTKKEKIFKQRLSKEGYYRTALTVKNKVSYLQVHRLVAEAFIDNPNNHPVVNHKDGNKLNNHVSNLEWTTSSLNQKHAYDTGLKKKKISLKQKLEIIELRKQGLTYYKIADKFNVSYQLIHKICTDQN